MKPQTPEHRQHMREAYERRIAAMTPEELAAWKASCRAFGLKSWEEKSEEDKRRQTARLQMPDARAHNAESVRRTKAALFAEDPDWLRKIMHEKWRRTDPLTLEQRKGRSNRSRAQMANASPEWKRKFADAARKARIKEIVGISLSDPSDERRFESATAAARWLVSARHSSTFVSARHCIYQACAGARKSAGGYRWSYVKPS